MFFINSYSKSIHGYEFEMGKVNEGDSYPTYFKTHCIPEVNVCKELIKTSTVGLNFDYASSEPKIELVSEFAKRVLLNLCRGLCIQSERYVQFLDVAGVIKGKNLGYYNVVFSDYWVCHLDSHLNCYPIGIFDILDLVEVVLPNGVNAYAFNMTSPKNLLFLDRVNSDLYGKILDKLIVLANEEIEKRRKSKK